MSLVALRKMEDGGRCLTNEDNIFLSNENDRGFRSLHALVGRSGGGEAEGRGSTINNPLVQGGLDKGVMQ